MLSLVETVSVPGMKPRIKKKMNRYLLRKYDRRRTALWPENTSTKSCIPGALVNLALKNSSFQMHRVSPLCKHLHAQAVLYINKENLKTTFVGVPIVVQGKQI